MTQWPTGTGTRYTGSDLPRAESAPQNYPARYYALIGDKPLQGTNRVVAWLDAWVENDLTWADPFKTKVPLTPEQWDYHFAHSQAVYDEGTFVDYTPPPPSLKEQAQAAMQSVQQQANMITAMGETFGPQMRDYVGRLREIVSGTDTTSTELPTAPSDPTH